MKQKIWTEFHKKVESSPFDILIFETCFMAQKTLEQFRLLDIDPV